MPSEALQLEVVTPEREVVREAVAEVQIPGGSGYLGVLPGHTPLLAALGVGTLSYRTGAVRRFLSVAGGVAEVLPERVTVMADSAERPEEIDVERARTALSKAEERLARGSSDPSTNWTEVLDAIGRARTRIEVAALRTDASGKEAHIAKP